MTFWTPNKAKFIGQTVLRSIRRGCRRPNYSKRYDVTSVTKWWKSRWRSDREESRNHSGFADDICQLSHRYRGTRGKLKKLWRQAGIEDWSPKEMRINSIVETYRKLSSKTPGKRAGRNLPVRRHRKTTEGCKTSQRNFYPTASDRRK